MTAISGLASLQKTLSDAQTALDAVNGELGTLSFDPEDPASIERAIMESERLVDERLGAYAENAIVGPLIQQMKDAYRAAVIEKAAESRAKEEGAGGE
jgi:hypothetical protein